MASEYGCLEVLLVAQRVSSSWWHSEVEIEIVQSLLEGGGDVNDRDVMVFLLHNS